MEKILVIRLGAIGDLILTSPALLNLKLSFPDAEISLLTRRNLVGLAEMFAGVDNILPFPLKASALDLFLMAEHLDKQGFNRILDLHGNIRSFYLRTHISAPLKAKYCKRRLERILAVRFHRLNPAPPHTIDLYNDAVRMIGGKVYSSRPVLNIAKHNKQQLNLDTSKKTVVIAPGASYPTKQWPKEKFVNLALEINRQLHCNIILALTENDRNLEQLSGVIDSNNLSILCDADLKDLAGIVSESDLLISNDSAMAHLGSAVGTPVVAIFGPTHPTLGFSPRGLHDVIVQVDEYCRPCSLHGKRPCFRNEQYCFSRISVNDVLERVSEILDTVNDESKAIFIDRDGTLIREKNFISNPNDVEPEDGSIEAIKMARKAGYKIIVVSNQSGVARGYFNEETVRIVNQRVLEIFGNNDAIIDDILYCPHYVDGRVAKYAIECSCRKPAPGMIETAARKHNINPFKSAVVGDKLADVSLAYVIGARPILVQTGYGKEQERLLNGLNLPKPEIVVQNLFESVKYLTG